MIDCPQMLLIGAAGRNSGKTEFATRLLRKLCPGKKIIGLKVTTVNDKTNCPRGKTTCNVCTSFEGAYDIREELEKGNAKDTRKLLDAGASQVFWLRALEEHLEEGFEHLLGQLDKDAAIICESNSLRTVVKPGLFFMVQNDNDKKFKASATRVKKYSDYLLKFNPDSFSFDFEIDSIDISDGTWVQKKTAIILAGGKSRRFGEDKSLVNAADGSSFINMVYDQLKPIFDEIIISTNDPSKYEIPDAKMVADKFPDSGPLVGIGSALEKSSNEMNFVIACDMPEINVELINRLVDGLCGYDAVIPYTEDARMEPLFATYRKSVSKIIFETLSDGKRKVRDVFPRINVNYLELSDVQRKGLTNLNTRDEYHAWLKKTQNA